MERETDEAWDKAFNQPWRMELDAMRAILARAAAILREKERAEIVNALPVQELGREEIDI